MVTFPGYHRPLTGTKLYCLVTKAQVCEQLAQGCWLKVERLGIEPATFFLQANTQIMPHKTCQSDDNYLTHTHPDG